MSDQVKKSVRAWFNAIAEGGFAGRMTEDAWPAIAEYIRDLECQNSVLRAANEAFELALAKPKGGNQ